MNPLVQLEGKVAVITGASRGIGAAIAHGFAAHGAKVAIAARKPEGLAKVAAAIEAAGGQALARACHVGHTDEVQALFAAAIERFGQVDVLVNNAATNPYFGPLCDISEGAFDKTIEVNLKGYFACSRELVRHVLGRQGQGAIVNVASVVGMHGAPFQGVYAMTKAAIISMTQTLAVEVGGRGIRVNAIAPGLIETRFAAALIESETIRQMWLGRTPVARLGQPEDIVGAALYLASDAAGYVNGHTLVVDGGFLVS
jgi:NAD(P)-dependent dehydrogenase (short-subunit alcohol dehydrogenase family)